MPLKNKTEEIKATGHLKFSVSFRHSFGPLVRNLRTNERPLAKPLCLIAIVCPASEFGVFLDKNRAKLFLI